MVQLADTQTMKLVAIVGQTNMKIGHTQTIKLAGGSLPPVLT